MQSPKSPVNNAGVRSTNSVLVTPSAFVPDIVRVSWAATVGIIVLKIARHETNVVAHEAGEEGNRAIAAVVIIIYDATIGKIEVWAGPSYHKM
jgi:hypothetical protein